MKVIAISGKAESGKDTIAKWLKQQLEEQNYKVMIIHFADVLKFVCRQYFDWNGEKDEYGRTLLQQVGTEMREKNNPNMWVDITRELIKGIGKEFDYVLVPDTRFRAEMDMLKNEFNAFALRVVRYDFDVNQNILMPHVNKLTSEQKNHKSECELDTYRFDYLAINNYNSSAYLAYKCFYEPFKKFIKEDLNTVVNFYKNEKI